MRERIASDLLASHVGQLGRGGGCLREPEEGGTQREKAAAA